MFIFYWWVIRISVLLLLPSLFYDIEVIFLVTSFLFIHLTLGLKGILSDYLHDKTSKILIIVLVRLTSFEFLRYILELLL